MFIETFSLFLCLEESPTNVWQTDHETLWYVWFLPQMIKNYHIIVSDTGQFDL